MAMWFEATTPSCYDHTFAVALQPLYYYKYIPTYIHIYGCWTGGGGG